MFSSSRLIAFLCVALLFISLEQILPHHRNKKIFRSQWRSDVLHFLVTGPIIKLLFLIPAFVIAALCNQFFISPELTQWVQAQPLTLQILESHLLVVFIAYWTHRASHSIPLLWKLHAVHHSSEEMDWLASARLHPLDMIWARSVQFSGVFLLGFQPEAFAALAGISSLLGIFIHSNLKIPLGPLKFIIPNPQHHHWHHSNHRTRSQSNYSFYPFIDWAFGTLYLPENQFPDGYGIGKCVKPGFLNHMLHPFRSSKNSDL